MPLKALTTEYFNKALLNQMPIARETVDRLRRMHSSKSPKELIKFLNKTYRGAVADSGLAAGMASVVPNGVVQVPVALGDLVAFFEASVLYVLTLAEIYGIDVEDIERRRFLVMTALLGDSGATTVTRTLSKRTVPYWSKAIIEGIPMSAIKAANKVLGPRFITKYGAKQGVLVLGKQLPLAIGAVVGAGANTIFGDLVVRSARKILGDPPADWNHLDNGSGKVVEGVVIEGVEPDMD